MEKGKKSRVKFTAEEDARVRELVSLYGDNWKSISTAMGNRNVRQVRERYLHYLNPNVNLSDWSPEEDDLLLELRSKYGARWTLFTRFFDGRSAPNIKNRFARLLTQRKKNLLHASQQISTSSGLPPSLPFSAQHQQHQQQIPLPQQQPLPQLQPTALPSEFIPSFEIDSANSLLDDFPQNQNSLFDTAPAADNWDGDFWSEEPFIF